MSIITFIYNHFSIETRNTSRLKFNSPKPRCAHAAVLVNNLIYVSGGGDGNIKFKELYTLDTDIAIRRSRIDEMSKDENIPGEISIDDAEAPNTQKKKSRRNSKSYEQMYSHNDAKGFFYFTFGS